MTASSFSDDTQPPSIGARHHSPARPKMLCVDDEPDVLEGIGLHLSRSVSLHTANSGAEALALLACAGPFAVVLSDMRMPGMDGATLLAQVREQAPEATRMMLTGETDIRAAMAAVNDGQIFRFLSKPCSPQSLRAAVRDGVRQYDLIRAEKDLLERTLGGAVAVLTDVMSLTNPTAFGRSAALRSYVRRMCRHLGIKDAWPFELAARLAHLGCITLSPDTLAKLHCCEAVGAGELEALEGHPAVGQRLLEQIPRLELVASIIGAQHQPPPLRWPLHPDPSARTDADTVALGAHLLAVALALDDLVIAGNTPAQGAARLQHTESQLQPQLVAALLDL